MAIRGATYQTPSPAADALSKTMRTMPAVVVTAEVDVFSAMDAILSPNMGLTSYTTDQRQASTSTRNFPPLNILVVSVMEPSSTVAVVETSRPMTSLLPSSQAKISAVPDPQTSIAAFTSQVPQQISIENLEAPNTVPSISHDQPQTIQTAWSFDAVPSSDATPSDDATLSNDAAPTDPMTSQTYLSSSTAQSQSHAQQVPSDNTSRVTQKTVVTVHEDSTLATFLPITSSSFLATSASVKTRSHKSHSVHVQTLSTESTSSEQPASSLSNSSPSSETSESPNGNHSHKTAALAAGMSVGCLVLLGVIGAFLIYRRKRKTRYLEDIRDGTTTPLSGSGADREKRIALPITRRPSSVITFTPTFKTAAASKTDQFRSMSSPNWPLPTHNLARPNPEPSQPQAATNLLSRMWEEHERRALPPGVQGEAGGSVPRASYRDILALVDGDPESPLGDTREHSPPSPEIRRGDLGPYLQQQHIDVSDPFTDIYHLLHVASPITSRTVSPLSEHQPPLSPLEPHPGRLYIPSERTSSDLDERVRRGRSDQFDLEKITSPVSIFAPSPLREEVGDGSSTPISVVSSLTGFGDTGLYDDQPVSSDSRSSLGAKRVDRGDGNRRSRSSVDSEVLGMLGGNDG